MTNLKDSNSPKLLQVSPSHQSGTEIPPHLVLAALNKQYPKLWQHVDKIRAEKAKEHWPEHVFLPLNQCHDLIHTLSSGKADKGVTHNLFTLGAWRVTQDIVKFDPDFFTALTSTENGKSLKIHKEILCRLPAWCLYFQLPDHAIPQYGVKAFYALWDYHAGQDRFMIYFLKTNHVLHSVTISCAEDGTIDLDFDKVQSELKDVIRPALNLVLYVCAYGLPNKPGNKSGNIARPQAKKVKEGWRLFPPPKVQEHFLGNDFGEAIRKARTQTSSMPQSGTGTHASPRPHIRRAHWHGYWFGTLREKAGKESVPRRFELRWIPPLTVALKEDDE